jgi:HEAT repeat protein
VNALGAIGDSRAIAPLANVQADHDSIVRENVAIALGNIGGSGAVRPLMASLRDPDARVREWAIGSLGKIGIPAVGPLIKILNGSDSVRRQDAIKALIEVGSPAAPALIAELMTGTLASRADEIDTLNQIGDTRSALPLIGLLGDRDRAIRALAADALGSSGDDRAVKFLEKAIHDENQNVRELAGISLTKLRSPLAVPQLLAVFKDDRDWDASDAIADMGPGATAPLTTAIKDPDPAIRRLAAESLEKIGGSGELWSVLAPALRNSDLSVLDGAHLLFIRSGQDNSEKLLAQALEQYGDQAMAEDFLGSKNAKLEDAAKTWALARNLQIHAHVSGVSWGSGWHLAWYGIPHTMKETAEERQRILDHVRSQMAEGGS